MHKPKHTEIEKTAYADNAGNTYRVEQASNKMFVCVRTNPGGNRKGYKEVGANGSLSKVQFELDTNARRNGWKVVA